jgi:hypothetical protein
MVPFSIALLLVIAVAAFVTVAVAKVLKLSTAPYWKLLLLVFQNTVWK